MLALPTLFYNHVTQSMKVKQNSEIMTAEMKFMRQAANIHGKVTKGNKTFWAN
jgi:hypothetical protein